MEIHADLGHGFGKLITISGQVVDTRCRADEDKTMFEVAAVEGVVTDEPVVITLETLAFHDLALPCEGETATLRGYEDGGFGGIPEEALQDVPMVATDGYRFRSVFIVTARLA